MVRGAIADGSALDTFAKMVKAQGGDPAWIYDIENFPKAKYQRDVICPADGYITGVDNEGYGTASLLLGAGRNTKDDVIDFAAGIRLVKKTGDRVTKGEVLATLYADREALLDGGERKFLESTFIGAEQPNLRPLILGTVE